MATLLSKTVTRQMHSKQLQGKYKGKPILVSLVPGDDLQFRIKGTRQIFSIYLGHCFRLAQISTYEAEYNQKLKDYKIKKAQGKRVKQIKRTTLPYQTMYFKAIS